MRLNTIKPAPGSKTPARRVGRGIGCGFGKTCGRGHKGQHSRSGGFHKVGFEGGQMPLQRRLPKVGFSSRVGRFVAEVRLSEIDKLDAEVVDLDILKATNVVPIRTRKARIIVSGEITRSVTITGVFASKGARAAIEAAGGKVED